MYAADLIGLDKVHAEIEQFRKTFGDHWRPSPLLARLAREGRRFGDLR